MLRPRLGSRRLREFKKNFELNYILIKKIHTLKILYFQKLSLRLIKPVEGFPVTIIIWRITIQPIGEFISGLITTTGFKIVRAAKPDFHIDTPVVHAKLINTLLYTFTTVFSTVNCTVS